MDDIVKNTENLYAEQIYAKQVRTVYGSFMIAIGGTFIGAILLMIIQWDVTNHKNILSWFGLFTTFHLIRAVFIYRFNKNQPDDKSCVAWGTGIVYSSFVAGLIWGLGVYVTFVPGDLTHELTVAIITVGLSAGAVSSLSVLRASFIAFVTPIMLSLVILFLIEDTYMTNIISIVVFLTMIFIMRGANNIYMSNKINFRLLLEAADRERLLIDAKEYAEIANKTQSEFLDNMSHELRTPLHGIMGFAQVGLESTKEISDKNLFKFFSRIMESSERLKILLDDLLDLRKIEEGKFELNLKPNDIRKIIKKCTDEQEAVLDLQNIEIKYNYHLETPSIQCDEIRIGQVVTNILSNAIKFSPSKGKITFSIDMTVNTLNKDMVKICVSDQGPGIAEEEHETIFNKFIQIKKSINNAGGTGLGLAITKEIINEHKGNVWCENNNNEGVTFCFVLPV